MSNAPHLAAASLALPRAWAFELPRATDFRGLVPAVLALNVADALFTLGYVTNGLAVEANPVMAHLLELHPVSFIVGKLGLVVLGLFVLWRNSHRPMAAAGILVLFLVYYVLLLTHIDGLGYITAEPVPDFVHHSMVV